MKYELIRGFLNLSYLLRIIMIILNGLGLHIRCLHRNVLSTISFAIIVCADSAIVSEGYTTFFCNLTS